MRNQLVELWIEDPGVASSTLARQGEYHVHSNHRY